MNEIKILLRKLALQEEWSYYKCSKEKKSFSKSVYEKTSPTSVGLRRKGKKKDSEKKKGKLRQEEKEDSSIDLSWLTGW